MLTEFTLHSNVLDGTTIMNPYMNPTPIETPYENVIENIHDLDSFIEFNKIGIAVYPELYLIFVCLAIYVMVKMCAHSNKAVKEICLKKQKNIKLVK